MPLESEEQRHLTAAQGYCELGMYLDANEELEEIDPFCRGLPEILGVRLEIYAGLKKWELMQAVATKLAQEYPANAQSWISLAYATRRFESIEAARVILLKAIKQHPKEPMLYFNLACYECQLADLTLAKEYLKRAFDIEPRFRLLALEDSDLEPLWDSLKSELK